MTALGKLFGVGVGPGASDLMTLRSVQICRNADVLAIPRKSEWDNSLAWRTAEPSVGEVLGQERLFLTFPMTKDQTLLRPAWDTAFSLIGERITAGKSVAFLCGGDPLLYGTFSYLLNEAPQRWPGVEVEIVPGVPSIVAVSAVTCQTIADGQERIAILPAMYGTEDLLKVIHDFDTIFLMKVGSVMPQVIEVLEQEGLLDRAVYVSKATTAQEKIVRDLSTLKNDKCDYFSMVMISKRNRQGILTGAGGKQE